MEYISPKLIKYLSTDLKFRNYNFNFLNIVNEYLETYLIYDYLSSSIEYKHKNIWNSLVQNWNSTLNDEKELLEYINITMDDDKLNNLLKDFIKDDKFKAIYVVVVIQKHI